MCSPPTGPESESTPTFETWGWKTDGDERNLTRPIREGHPPLRGSNRTSLIIQVPYRKATKAHETDDEERWEPDTVAGTLSAHSLGLPASMMIQEGTMADEPKTVMGHETAPTLDHDPTAGQAVGGLIFGWDDMNQAAMEEASPPLTQGRAKSQTGLIFSAEDSPAKTSPSPDAEEDSPVSVPDSSSSSPGSLTLFDPPGCSSRTYPGFSPRTMVGTSASFWERWPSSGTAWPGGCSTHATSESPNAAVECSLSAILEETVDPRYLLSAKAAQGILRRATARGRALPSELETTLRETAATATDPTP